MSNVSRTWLHLRNIGKAFEPFEPSRAARSNAVAHAWLTGTSRSRFPHAAGCGNTLCPVSPTWIWLQAAIVVFVLIGIVIAIVRLA